MSTSSSAVKAILSARSAQRVVAPAALTRPGRVQRIDITDRDQVSRWCRVYGVTPLQLCSAVESAGGDPARVRQFLAPH